MNKEAKVVIAKTWIINLIIEFIKEHMDEEDDEMKVIFYNLISKIHSINV